MVGSCGNGWIEVLLCWGALWKWRWTGSAVLEELVASNEIGSVGQKEEHFQKMFSGKNFLKPFF